MGGTYTQAYSLQIDLKQLLMVNSTLKLKRRQVTPELYESSGNVKNLLTTFGNTSEIFLSNVVW